MASFTVWASAPTPVFVVNCDASATRGGGTALSLGSAPMRVGSDPNYGSYSSAAIPI
jgi:hypothetical protein